MDSRSRQPTAAADKLTLTPVLTLGEHTRCAPSISYFPDGKRMISGSEDKTTRQWDMLWGYQGMVDGLSQAVEMITLPLKGSSEWKIECIDISGDSTETLLAGAEGFTVRIWNLETGKLIAGPFKSTHYVGAIRFSHNWKKLAVKSWGNHFEVWDVQTQKLNVKVGTFGRVGKTSTPVFWTTEDKTIVAAFSLITDSPTTICELDAYTLETVGAPFEGHTNTITGLALSLDCTLLTSVAYHDNTIKLWAFEFRQLLASFDVMYACHLILSPDSCQLVYTTLVDTNIYLCNIPSEFLTSIQRLQQVRASAPRNPPLVDSGAFFLTTNKFTSDTSPNAQQSLPSHSLVLPSVSFARRRAGFESGTSRIQPTDTDSSPDKRWGKYFEPGFHPLHDSSFSYTHTVFFTGNDERDDLPPKATLQDLSEFITKDGDYPVARGGFGEIWKCTFDIGRGSVKVAVKALQVYADDQFGAAKTKKINRMKRELMICANLNHANILPVHGYTTGFGPFIAIVSPWAESGNLTTYLKREHADLILLRRFEILRDVIAGLQYLHANNVIHGDFSGPNVLIHGDGTACISDFGLSLMYSEVISASQASWTSTLKGNMRWMAPERLVLEREDGSPTRPSEQSDIFSFGGVMLQVLTNEIPYYYLANDAAIVLCIARSETPSRARYSELSEKYWQFIEQCWSTDPRDRPSTDEANETIRNEFYSLSGSR